MSSDEEDSGGACDNYRIDLTAAEFGTCKCGFPKAAHKSGGGAPRSKVKVPAAKAAEPPAEKSAADKVAAGKAAAEKAAASKAAADKAAADKAAAEKKAAEKAAAEKAAKAAAEKAAAAMAAAEKAAEQAKPPPSVVRVKSARVLEPTPKPAAKPEPTPPAKPEPTPPAFKPQLSKGKSMRTLQAEAEAKPPPGVVRVRSARFLAPAGGVPPREGET